MEFEVVGFPNLSATGNEKANKKLRKIFAQYTNLDPKLYYNLAPLSFCFLVFVLSGSKGFNLNGVR